MSIRAAGPAPPSKQRYAKPCIDMSEMTRLAGQGFFDSLGLWLGSLIRFVVEALSGVFSGLGNAAGDFLTGLARALGMQPSFLGLCALVIGLLLLIKAVRRLIQRRWISGVLWMLFSLWLLSAMIA